MASGRSAPKHDEDESGRRLSGAELAPSGAHFHHHQHHQIGQVHHFANSHHRGQQEGRAGNGQPVGQWLLRRASQPVGVWGVVRLLKNI